MHKLTGPEIAAIVAADGAKVYVIKTADGVYSKHDRTERLELTGELCTKIARHNGNMGADEVRAALLAGVPVFTNFSRYQKEDAPVEPRT